MSTMTDTHPATSRLKIKVETFASTAAALSGQVDANLILAGFLVDKDGSSSVIGIPTISGNAYTTPAGTNGHNYWAIFICE